MINSATTANNRLAVSTKNTEEEQRLVVQRIASQLSLPYFQLDQDIKQVNAYDYLLLVEGSYLSLAKTGKGAPAPVAVDFISGTVAHRRKYGGGKGQDIAKAIGINKKRGLTVYDATAGLGRDAFVLATLGCKVTLFERVPFVWALLHSGLEKAQDDFDVMDIIANMALAEGTLQSYSQTNNKKADVVYLDPMYPHSEKSAAAKKEMAFFRDLIGQDHDADELLPTALSMARYRVVVKRPKSAPYLNNETPTYQISGKAGRFDVYVLKSLDNTDDL